MRADTKQGCGDRLKRIEGQVRGIARMIEEDRYCIDVLTQISAARAALDKVALGLLDDHAHHCVMGADTAQERDEKTAELMDAVGRLMRRLGHPLEIGSVVAFLASADASYITGQVIYVDGGITAQLYPRGQFI